MSYPSIVAGLWVIWLIYWAVAGRRAKATQWREPVQSQLVHQGLLVVAGTLLATSRLWPAAFNKRLLPEWPIDGAVGLILVVLGLGFAVWARQHLGANWSSAVELKDRHTLIRSGPYRYVRHPIYTGLLMAAAGTAIVVGEWRGALAVALAFVALVYKSRHEERRMQETFVEYADYCRTTPALIPFIY